MLRRLITRRSSGQIETLQGCCCTVMDPLKCALIFACDYISASEEMRNLVAEWLLSVPRTLSVAGPISARNLVFQNPVFSLLVVC